MPKKVIAAMLSVITLFSLAACNPVKPSDISNTGTPENKETEKPTVEFPKYETETVELKNLKDYTIVYPSNYTEYRKQEVKVLRDTIKKITGAELDIISDNEAKKDKEIIIASSLRENGLEDALEKLPHGLDYVVAVRNGNIILGGNNFYADMRAIYNFINNTLGYDDIENKQDKGKTDISGVNYTLYEEPVMRISGSNYSVSAFTEQYVVRDMAKAHFNLILINSNRYNDEQILDFIKWCARYEIFVCLNGEKENRLDLFYDCPIIYSTYVVDEPKYDKWKAISAASSEYVQKYGKYGWKPFVNFCLPLSNFDFLTEWKGLFDECPMICLDTYWGHTLLVDDCWIILNAFEKVRHIAQSENKDLWSYIECYNVTNKKQNTSKMLRWHSYVYLSFGTKNIFYFQYGDASPNWHAEGDWSYGSLINWDYSKNQSWFDAEKVNDEILELVPIYSQYKSVGPYIIGVNNYPDAYFENPYPYFNDIILDYKYDDGEEIPCLMGFFDKNDNNSSHAFTLINVEDLNDTPYEEDEAKYMKIKINGENVKFYRNGKVQDVEKDTNGYYNVNMSNGFCWFVTVD